MPTPTIPGLHLRGSTWHLRRRVPKRFFDVEERRDLWLSLHTDSRNEAERKAREVWDELVVTWEARLSGAQGDAATRLASARALAGRKGIVYRPAADVAELPLEDILSRAEAIKKSSDGTPDRIDADALLGGAGEDALRVSGVLAAFWPIARDRIIGKSDDQVRRWRNPRIRAFADLQTVIGDVRIDELGRDEMLRYRDWWIGRIEAQEVTPQTAEKAFAAIKGVLRAVVDDRRMQADLPLQHLRLVGVRKRTAERLPFSTPWIRDQLLAPDAFRTGGRGGLNDEARAIFLAMVNTGARPSEIAGLEADAIRLDADVPHISIEPRPGRQLKNRDSERVIPLVGTSLEAIRAFPEGFPRYSDDPTSLSAAVNKSLRAHGLAETERHTMYGLRHSFEDRLLDADVDERIRRDLMGHSLGGRQRYGKGASLEKLYDAVRKIAL